MWRLTLRSQQALTEPVPSFRAQSCAFLLVSPWIVMPSAWGGAGGSRPGARPQIPAVHASGHFSQPLEQCLLHSWLSELCDQSEPPPPPPPVAVPSHSFQREAGTGWGTVRERRGKKEVDTYAGSPALGDREVGLGGRRPLPAVQCSPAGGKEGVSGEAVQVRGEAGREDACAGSTPVFFPAPPRASSGRSGPFGGP